MSQLIDFIPRTFSACRSLLKDIQGATTFTVADRNGVPRTLGPDELSELTGLIESQIGEKAPAPAPKPEPKKKPAKKTAKK
jgi:hypothetical protein